MRRRQEGVALIALMVIVALSACWYLVSRLNAMTGDVTAARRKHDAAVLAEAKRALIGYVAMKAANTTERNPGRLPCPEPSAWAGVVDAEGISAPGTQGGINAPTCATVGRLPWRTLGIDQLRDSASEPLWYVVGPTWRLTNSSSTLQINSNTEGDLTIGGTAKAAVALIIAPGAATSGQTRSAPSSSIDAANYLECFNAAATPPSFSLPSCSGNDGMLVVTAADLLPAIEAAVADRFERQIAPAWRAVYSGAEWGGGNLLPFALTFGDPSVSATYQASAVKSTHGVMPLSYSESSPGSSAPCTSSDPRCQPAFLTFTSASMSGPSITSSTCTPTTVPPTNYSRIDCTFRYTSSILAPPTSVSFTLQAVVSNAGMALRQFNTSVPMSNVASATATGTLNADGSATVLLNGAATAAGSGGLLSDLLCGLGAVTGLLFDCYNQTISVPIFLLADHPLVSENSANYGWFLRNKWHETAYYAVADGLLPGGGGSCTTGTSCLQVAYDPDSGKQRALVILSGRSLSNAARPNGTLTDWLEGENCDLSGGVCLPDRTFAVRSPTLLRNRSFNDRIAVIDTN